MCFNQYFFFLNNIYKELNILYNIIYLIKYLQTLIGLTKKHYFPIFTIVNKYLKNILM